MSIKTELQIIAFCKKFYKERGRFPTLTELKENGITRELIRQKFNTKAELEAKTQLDIEASILEAPKGISKLGARQKRYVIVGVQNNTFIDRELMACLDTYAEENKATILGLPMYYKNPTSQEESAKLDKKYWWDESFSGEYVTQNMNLGKYLKLMPEQRISITSMNPLSGLEHIAGKYSAIYANPQFQMKVVPESQDKSPHILHTTGTVCNKGNFSKTNAGGKAEGFAVKGALVIELDGDVFHLRQLEYKEDCICDLGITYRPDGIEASAEATMIWGDIHAEVSDETVIRASMKMADDCNISSHYLHDVLDFSCQSHHNNKNFLMKYMLGKHGKDKVSLAIKDVAEFINRLTSTGSSVNIVDSNHHDHITRWINENDFKCMGHDNAYFYISLVKKVLETMTLNEDTLSLSNDNVLLLALEIIGTNLEKVEFLDRNESHTVKGVELSQHGDVGPNGSRGSITGFGKTNGPLVIGHSHTPGINRHVFQVGKTAHLQQSYMRGYSSHLHTHCIIYPNGARSLINIIGGKYRL